jgi:hypothetical protein
MKINHAIREYSNSANNNSTCNELLGLMVELCFVQGIAEARILSWASAKSIDAVVVENSNLAKIFYRLRMKVLPLDQIIPYQLMFLKETEGNKNRFSRYISFQLLNSIAFYIFIGKEIEEGQLPMTPIVMTDKSGKRIVPQGNPKYMVSEEHL